MATWTTLTGVKDFVRSPQPEGQKVAYLPVENEDNSGTRVFTETDLDNRTITAVWAATGATPDVDKGSDGSSIAGFVEDISEDGAVVDLLIIGVTNDVGYAAASEDPDVGNSVVSKGDGTVKQSTANPSESAGQAETGRGRVFYKDTTNSYCRIVFP